MKQYLILFLAIICEVAFYLLSIVMRSIPIGISYAIWSGVHAGGACRPGSVQAVP